MISAFWAFAQDPRPGEVYNLGGGKANAASLLECVELVADASRRQAARCSPTTTQARVGDHICYYSDMAKFRAHFPGWRQEHDLAGHRRGDGGRGRRPSSADGRTACG